MNTKGLQHTRTCFPLALLATSLLLATPSTADDFAPAVDASRQDVRTALTIEAIRYLTEADPTELGTIRALVRQAGEMRITESIPDLVLLLDNEPRGFLADECIEALTRIGDERVVLPLAGELRWSSGSGRLRSAIAGLEAVAQPLAPILVRSLASDNELVRRRAIYVINLLSRESVRDNIRRHTSHLELFRFRPALKLHLQPLLRDPSSVVRFEALGAYLALSENDAPEAITFAGDDPSLSVQQVATAVRSTAYGSAWPNDGWLPLRALASRGPVPREYSAVSEWRPWKDSLQIRVSVSDSELSLPEPTYLLNAPVWIRLELRNNGSGNADITTDKHGIPLAPLAVRDQFGLTQAVGANPKVSHFSTKSASLAPGQSATWEFHLLRECRFWGNGTFTFHSDWQQTTPALLSVVVRDIPVHPWRPGEYSRLGLSRDVVTYSRQPLEPLPAGFVDVEGRRTVAQDSARFGGGLIDRFTSEGDRDALVSLTHIMPVAEISRRLLAAESSAQRTPTEEDSVLTEDRSQKQGRYNDLQLVFDGAGRPHAVFTKQHLVPVKKYDRSTGRMTTSEWRYSTQHVTGDVGKWSDPFELSGPDLAFSMPRLMLDKQGAAMVLGLVSRPSPVRGADGLETRRSDVVLRRLTTESGWGAVEQCFTIESRMMHGLDAAVDADGAIHVVWAPWFDNEYRQQLHHRQLTTDDWSAERLLPGLNRNLQKPRLLFADGLGTVLATGQTPDYRSTGIYWYELQGKDWAGPRQVSDGIRTVWWPSRQSTIVPALGSVPATSKEGVTVFRRSVSGIEELSSLFSLPDMDGWYELVSVTVDSNGRPYGLANWHGVIILFRQANTGETEALLVSDPGTWEEGARALGDPELAVGQGRWHALWGEGAENAGRVRYSRGLIPESGWMDPRRLGFLLRPHTGFTASDLRHIQAGVLNEARDAEAAGRLDLALERYAYLVLNQTALFRGGHGSKGEERKIALERLTELYQRGDETTHAFLWSLVRNQPDALYPADNLWKLLLESVDPKVLPHVTSHGRSVGG